MAQEAKEIGWDVDVLTTDPIFKESLINQGLRVINLEVIWRKINPLKDLLGLNRLYSFLKKSNYTIIHTHTSKAGFVGRLAAYLAGIPIIIHTAHGFAFHEQSSSLEICFYSSLEKLASNWCDKIVCVSDFHKKWALRLGIANEAGV